MDTLFSNISVITMDERMQTLTDAFVGVTDHYNEFVGG